MPGATGGNKWPVLFRVQEVTADEPFCDWTGCFRRSCWLNKDHELDAEAPCPAIIRASLAGATRGFDATVGSKIGCFGRNQLGCVRRCFRFAPNLALDFGLPVAIARQTNNV